MKNLMILGLSTIALVSCNEPKTNAEESADKPIVQVVDVNVTGNYVSEGFATRDQGADWVAVNIENTNDSVIKIAIRSRADIKKPTCTFDAVAEKQDASTYVAVSDNKKIIFKFTGDQLTISPAQEADRGLLNYFCSGGASIAGDYLKTTDSVQ